ncbi:MAG TPA: sensor histidine kinase [Pseudonocardiaceae bacterium]|nr:sensor histidine kinase [Pseudonocardiaceae bacterium]
MGSGQRKLSTAARAIRPRSADAALACVLTLFVLGATSGIAHWHANGRHLDGLGLLWLVGGGVPLAWRRTAPATAFVLTTVAVFSYYLSNYPGGPSVILPTVALVTLAYLRGPTVAGIAAGALVTATVAGVLVIGDPAGTLDPRLFGVVLWGTGAVAVGTVVQLRRAAARSSAERAAEADRLRAEEQRLGIAREVHDVVAHSLAMINVQAGVAAHVADRRPDEAKAALLAIKEASRSALADLRATLGVLRSGDDRSPTPGLGRLPDLIDVAAAAGITVRADGDAGALPAPVDVAAYRILQECLTNVVRHGKDADTVAIRLARTEDELEITVLDNGKAAKPGTAGGNGLRGMAERAQALGGDAVAGPMPGGGFQVHARLPLTGDTR